MLSPRRISICTLLLALPLSLGAGAIGGCSQSDSTASTSGEAVVQTDSLKQTINDLAAFGAKRIGTPAGAKAADYIKTRMEQAQLEQVRYEEFDVPVHTVSQSAVSFTIDGAAQPDVTFEVFEASGSGNVQNASMVYLGSGKPEDYNGKDVTGKVVFVKRDNNYHRSSQFLNAEQHGAVAMLYQSTVPNNLAQTGSVRDTWEAMGTIPAISIGSDDGDNLQKALGSHDVRANIQVTASSQKGTGRNVVGIVPGKNYGKTDGNGASLDHLIVIGGHYDTWYTGSLDNGSGVAAMLYFAGKRGGTDGRLGDATLAFVAYDGEETGLYGGYDFLRKHQDEGIISVVNFEMPAAEADFSGGFIEGIETLVKGVAASDVPALHTALDDSRTAGLFDVFKGPVTLDFVERTFGGIIPTDIQGIYRSGIATVSTASDSPYYHTTQDTPDKVDFDILARGVQAFDRAVLDLGNTAPGGLAVKDPTLWDASLDVTVNGDSAQVNVVLHDETGNPAASTNVTATLFCDDFFAQPNVVQQTDGSGNVTFSFTGLTDCAPNRYVHVSAGKDYPLVEKVKAVPASQ